MQGASKQNREKGPSDPVKLNKRESSVGQRWLTALVLMPVVLLFTWFGGWAAFIATFLVVVFGALELHTMLLNAGYRPLIWISFGLSVLFLVAVMFPAQHLLILEIGLGASLLISFPWLFFREKLDGALIDWALTLAIAIYLGWPMSFILLLRGNQPAAFHPANGVWLSIPAGIWWLLATFLGVWSFDGAAFFAGRYFGRHKIAPRISPGKTWEGAIGGLLFCTIACLLVTVVPLGIPWYLSVVLAILISWAAVVGDLAESLIKRQTHVKDSGQMMPGHGGMLDRVDSMLFVVIVVYVFAQLVAK